MTWIDILDIAGELSGVVAELTHPAITKTPAKENWHQWSLSSHVRFSDLLAAPHPSLRLGR
jgi:hypothetical protein